MSLSRRGILTGTLALGATAGLAACGGGTSATDQGGPATAASGDGGAGGYSGPKVNLAFWNGFTGGDGPFMKTLVDQFNKEHENIAVAVTTMAWGDYYTKLPAAVTAGKAPEIGIAHADSVPTLAATKSIQPLDDVATALKLTEADFAEVAWRAGIFRDARYSIPLDVHPAGFWWNKTLFEQAGLDPENPPMTKDDFTAALAAFKSKNIQGFWVNSGFPCSLAVQSFIYQFGGAMIADDGLTAKWADDPGVEALTWFQSMIKDGNSPAKVAGDAEFTALQNGKNPMAINGIWNISPMKEKTNLKWGVKALPMIGSQKAVWAGSHQFVLPVQKTSDENKQVAARVFLNWISTKSLEWAKAGQVPARNSVRDTPEFKALTEQVAFAEQLPDVRLTPPIPGVGDAMGEFGKAFEAIMVAMKDPATELKAAADRANKILEANAKKYAA